MIDTPPTARLTCGSESSTSRKAASSAVNCSMWSLPFSAVRVSSPEVGGRLAVQSGTRRDARSGGDEQNLRARLKLRSLPPECSSKRGGVHALVVGDADLVHRYPEPVAQRGSKAGPGGSGDNHVDAR